MYITLESDYAVRIISCLANADKRLDAKTIADQTGVTLRFALKILRKLVSVKIVKSFKGTQGGYELDKDPAQISLRNVIETVEGTYQLNRCLDGTYPCTRGASGQCEYQKAFQEISDVVKVKLDEYTFDRFLIKKKK